MGLFVKKKVYCIEWRSIWDIHRRDFIEAKNEGDAWKKIKRREGSLAAYCDNIVEVGKKEIK